MTEAGATEWPPLLSWLEQSVTEVVKRGGAGSNGAGIPIDFEALRILNHIKHKCGQIREALYLPKKTSDLIHDVAEVWKAAREAHKKNEVDDARWALICDEIESWVQMITAEQDVRPRKMELVVPCPRCGTRWISEPVDDSNPTIGEDRKTAVVIEYADGRAPVAECRVDGCGAMWAGWAQIAQLGFTVQADMNLEVLAACGIKLEFDTQAE